MKAPLNWIKSYVDIDVDPHGFASAMTMSGSKVETLEYLGSDIENVVFGRAVSVEKHPDADKLFICMIDIGRDTPIQIVTAATNVKPGNYMPVALDGAVLPCGKHIKSGKLRGVVSNGMLCSFGELNLTQNDVPYADENGIWILPDGEYPLGDDIKKMMGFDDYVVDFEITSNRPDCLSITGLAREAGATFGKKFNLPETKYNNEDKKDSASNYISVEVLAPDLCPRYIARVVKDVKIAPSPQWMRDRLRAAGVRPINNIVDITNYVMLEFGQPLHSFDHTMIKGKKIIVRRAKKGEIIKTLDNIDRALDDSMLVICDEQSPVAVAGVMGGEFSGINNDTRTIVFESANFFGPSVRITAKKLGMRTEASGRFEKGLDPSISYLAAERACQLCELIGAGTVVSGRVDVDNSNKTPKVLKLEPDKINRFLGTDIKKDTMVHILESLEFKVDHDLNVTVPSFRSDVEAFADLSEEVARIYGYDKIPTTLFKGETTQGMLSSVQQAQKKVHSILLAQGLYEISTYSFISPKYYDKIALASDSPLRRSVTITNPLGEDTSIMRTTALPSMLEALSLNQSHRNAAARLYELGRIYLPKSSADELPEERDVITIGFYGKGDFYDLKGMLESLFDGMSLSQVEYQPVTDDPSFHPGRCAKVTVCGQPLGILGEIHPNVLKNYEFAIPVYASVIDFNTLIKNSNPEKQYKPLPKFPAVTRDIALICDDSIPVSKIEQVMKENAGKLLESIALFDVYKGEQISAGKKSVAYSLILRDEEKTLTYDDAEKITSKIIKALEKELNATLRL